MKKTGSKFTLRTLLFTSLVLISTIPVIILSLWVNDNALEQEYKAVHEKHLIIAKNLTTALSRYIMDLKASLHLVPEKSVQRPPGQKLSNFFKQLHVKQIWFVSNKLEAKLWLNTGQVSMAKLPKRIKKFLRSVQPQLAISGSKSVVSGILGTKISANEFCIVRRVDDNTLIVASISTQYIRQLQKAISFGKRGHAAIVDRSGRVLAHPLEKWTNTMHDMSFLPPVKKMQRGITGVTKFYTPAMKADMVAGHTTVVETGWGVMIPQPVSELEERAGYVKVVALLVAVMGILITGTISWWLASYITAPLSALVKFTHEIGEGDTKAISIAEQRLRPREVTVLVQSFDTMASKLRDKSAALAVSTTRLKEAQRIAKLGHWELDPISNRMWWSGELYNMLGISNDALAQPSFSDFTSMMNVKDRHRFSSYIQSLEPNNEHPIDIKIILTNSLGQTLLTQHKIISKASPGTNQLIIRGTIQDVTEH